jgi:antitoxin component HigA of HigAB toxin-antitoxin module
MSVQSLQSQLDSVQVQIKSELDKALAKFEAAKAEVRKAREAERIEKAFQFQQYQGALRDAKKQIRTLMKAHKITVEDLT